MFCRSRRGQQLDVSQARAHANTESQKGVTHPTVTYMGISRLARRTVVPRSREDGIDNTIHGEMLLMARKTVTMGRTSICDAVGVIPVGRWRIETCLLVMRAHTVLYSHTDIYRPIDAELRPTPDDVDLITRDEHIL